MAREINKTADAEVSQAKRDFSSWQSNQAALYSTPALEKRKKELYALVRMVIKNELDAQQKEIVQLHWYEGKSLSEISEIMKLDRSTVFRKEKKINEILYDKLKYAMQYRFGDEFSHRLQCFFEQDIILKNARGETVSERLFNLRKNCGLTQKDVSVISDITEERLNQIEKSGEQATVNEIRTLSELYGASANFIIYGKEKKQNKEEFNETEP